MEVERREWKVGSCTRLSAVRCRGAACRSWRCTADSYWVTIKWQRPPSLSLRGRSAPVAISGRHSQPVQAAVKMEKAEIWGVAALTAQPLAALPPYGCGVPFTGSERLACWQSLRHAFCGVRPSSLSLRGVHRPTWQSRNTRPDRGEAVGENVTAFPRLPRAQSALAMTNLWLLPF